jgi:multisubunit Na+/H+ antiporter MnhG subunit
VHPLSVTILLGLAVGSEVVCVAGILLSATVYDRLHFSGATTAVAPLLFLAAVAVERGHTNPTWNAVVDAIALIVLNSTLTHATAGVARRRVGRTELEL